MKRIITLIATVFAVTGAFSQFTENFNSRPEAALTEVKNNLTAHCWQFRDFDINNGGWDPAIEGDGAMISGPGATSTQNTGILSPQLSLNGTIQVSFKYKFSANVTDRRWLTISSTYGDNTIARTLDSIELTGNNNTSVYTYNKTLHPNVSGCYKIYIKYAGIDGENRIAIDELILGANTCFSGGCNQPPVAVNDYMGGGGDYTASGDVLPNDSDPEHGALTSTLVTNSPDGNVNLTDYGMFTFTPNPGFKGLTTSFTYMICDNGTPSLCSDIATVLITFQGQGALPVTLTDFGAIYANDKVNVKWTSTFELNNDRYEVERSTDGINFKSVGSVKGMGNSSIKHEYQFNDDVSKNVLNRNDMYYRLKQVDLDGRSSFTKVLVVRVYRTKTLQSLSVTPNPAINDIKVNIQLNENAYIVLKVANSTGTEVMRKTTRGANGTNSLRLEGTSRLQAGVYFLEVIVNSNERMMVKLIKN
ncbi:MAG: Ig-like domain-containing protein [Chitinophagaceae bacterium]